MVLRGEAVTPHSATPGVVLRAGDGALRRARAIRPHNHGWSVRARALPSSSCPRAPAPARLHCRPTSAEAHLAASTRSARQLVCMPRGRETTLLGHSAWRQVLRRRGTEDMLVSRAPLEWSMMATQLGASTRARLAAVPPRAAGQSYTRGSAEAYSATRWVALLLRRATSLKEGRYFPPPKRSISRGALIINKT